MNTKIQILIACLTIHTFSFCAETTKKDLNPPLSAETIAAYAACKQLEKKFAARTIVENNGYASVSIDPGTGERIFTPVSSKVIQRLSKAEQAQLNDAHESLRKTNPGIFAINRWPFVPEAGLKFTTQDGYSFQLNLAGYTLARSISAESISRCPQNCSGSHLIVKATSPAKINFYAPFEAFLFFKKRKNPSDVKLTTPNGISCYAPQDYFQQLTPIQYEKPNTPDPLSNAAARLRQLR